MLSQQEKINTNKKRDVDKVLPLGKICVRFRLSCRTSLMSHSAIFGLDNCAVFHYVLCFVRWGKRMEKIRGVDRIFKKRGSQSVTPRVFTTLSCRECFDTIQI